MEKEYKIKSVNVVSPNYKMALGLFNKNIETLEIPEGTTEIKNTIMENLKTLKKVVLPSSLIKIEYMSFYDCSSLEVLLYNGTISEWKKIEIGSSVFEGTLITEVQCKDGVVAIGGT